MTETSKPATWRVVLAFILDLIGSFALFGYIIASVTGDTTQGGFELTGGPALVLFALVIAYFVLMPRFGGRVFQRFLRAI